MILDRAIIVITGASSGIGEQAALQLSARGAHVCLVARRREELERVQLLITEAGGSSSIYPADLSSEEDVDRCAREILAEHGKVDVLVNNAGRSIRRSIRNSLERGHGHIINVTTMAVQTASPGYSAYVASKMALEGYSRVLSSEMTGSGIRVTLVRYPLVRTPMSGATDLYRKIRMMSPSEAARWIVRAVDKRPARVGTLLGEMAEVANVLMPGPTERMTGRVYQFMGRRQHARAEK